MAKAHITLPNGTKVAIEGKPEEVQQLLEFYGGSRREESTRRETKKKGVRGSSSEAKKSGKSDTKADLAEIVNLLKSCDEAEAIETQILDRTSQVDRTLLPLYAVHEHMDNKYPLTSGEISTITTELGIPIATANVSRTLSGTASKYVIGDKVRKKGQPVKYKLSRRGVQYIKKVIEGSSGDN